MAKREDVQARLEAIREASSINCLAAIEGHQAVLAETAVLWQLLLGEEAPQSRFRSIAGKATAQATTRQLPLVGEVDRAS